MKKSHLAAVLVLLPAVIVINLIVKMLLKLVIAVALIYVIKRFHAANTSLSKHKR